MRVSFWLDINKGQILRAERMWGELSENFSENQKKTFINPIAIVFSIKIELKGGFKFIKRWKKI